MDGAHAFTLIPTWTNPVPIPVSDFSFPVSDRAQSRCFEGGMIGRR